MKIKLFLSIITLFILVGISYFSFIQINTIYLKLKKKNEQIFNMQVSINELKRRNFYKEFTQNDIYNLDGKKVFDIYKFNLPFEDDIQSKWPLGYIEKFQENLLYMTSDGKLYYYKNFFPYEFENLNKKHNTTKINTNFDEFDISNNDKNECININDYVGANGNSYFNRPIRDTLVLNGDLYVAMLNINKKNNSCFLSTKVIKGEIDLNQNNISFETFFEIDYEVDLYDSRLIDTHMGGVMTVRDKKILLGYPDYGITQLAQKNDNPFGKIIEITSTNEYKIISLGNRNPQGLFYDEEEKLIFETEHGPEGGDEINLIKQGKNYGWPIASYYKDDPPYKFTKSRNHKSLGFEEPLWAVKSQKEWDFNIGPSRIIKFNGKYLVLSMSWAWDSGHGILEYERFRDKFNLIDKYHLFSRVRDILNIEDKYLIAVLESTNEIIILRKYDKKFKKINFNITLNDK
jgi:hypothetical protein